MRETRRTMMARRRSAGTAAVEFALILPLFLLMMLGMMEYGWYFYVDLAASNAAREGARAGSTQSGACNAGNATAQTGALNYLKSVGLDKYATVSVACTTASWDGSGDPLYDVKVNMAFPRLTGFALIPIPNNGSNLTGSAEVVMRGSQ